MAAAFSRTAATRRAFGPLLSSTQAAAPAGVQLNAVRAFSTAKADSIPIAATDDGAPTSSVTVAIRAGPRYENTPGAAHVLKNFFFKSNAKRSALRIVREAELYGGVLSTSISKEHILLTADFLRGDEDFFVEVLGDAVSSAKFVRHEFDEEVVPSVQLESEAAHFDPTVLGFDTLTSTAYRYRGVGASLFASPSAPVPYSSAINFAKASLNKSNIAVLGSGLDATRLSGLVSKKFGHLAGGAAAFNTPSKYFGGEQRVSFAPPHGSESVTAGYGHLFLAFEGADTSSSAELAVLRALLGGESSVKWSSGQSPLSKAAESIPGATANAFNLTFSDTGLFGTHISAPHESILQLAKSVGNVLKDVAGNKKPSEEDVKRAIAKAKFEAASNLESRASSHEVISASLLESGGKIHTLDETIKAIEGVSIDKVAKAAEKGLKGKPTTVAVGDVHRLPYADELI